jgi:hypothetical protein
MVACFLARVCGFSLCEFACGSDGSCFGCSSDSDAEFSRSWGDYLQLVVIKDFPWQGERPDSFYGVGVGFLSGASFFANYGARHCDGTRVLDIYVAQSQ